MLELILNINMHVLAPLKLALFYFPAHILRSSMVTLLRLHHNSTSFLYAQTEGGLFTAGTFARRAMSEEAF